MSVDEGPAASVSIPLAVRLRLARASVQTIADGIGADLLHIKGDMVDEDLNPSAAAGTDVDVLVRPAHIRRMHSALSAHGWTVYSTFVNGSPFGHAQTYKHETWGYLDLHRLFPGIRLDPAQAFETLWTSRVMRDAAGVRCCVPDAIGQALIQLLNTARNPSDRRRGAAAEWTDATDDRRLAVRELARVLDAQVALAAATGELDAFRDRREHDLWKLISEGGGKRTVEWRARVRAEPTVGGAVLVALRAPRVNVEHLAYQLGRAPTRREIVRAYVARAALALREVRRGG